MSESAEEKAWGKSKYWIPEESRAHFRNAQRELRRSIEGLFPPSFVEHRRAARREMLMAVRTFIDHKLEALQDVEEA
jgi:hypothetical protein